MATGRVIDRLTTILDFKVDGRGLDRLDRGINRARRGLDGFAMQAGLAGVAITTALGLTAKAAATLESAWSELSAKTGQSVDDLMRRYGDAVREISDDVGLSQEAIIAGFQKAISAGTEGSDAIRLVGEAAEFQAAKMGSMEEAISAATTAAVIYGVDGTEAINKVARAAQIGEGDVADYSQAFKGVLQQAKPLNISINELLGTMSAMAQQTKTVSDAETQMNGFLRAVVNLGREGSETIKRLEDMSKGTLTYADLMVTLERGGMSALIGTLQTLTGMDPTKIAALFPEAEAQKFLNTADPETIARLSDALQGADGTIGTAFDERADDMAQRAVTLKEQLTNIMGDLGEATAPTLHRLLDLADRILGKWREMGSGTKKLAGQLLLAGPALLALAVAAKGLSLALGTLVPLIKILRGSLFLVGGPVGALVLAILGLIFYWDDLSAAVKRAGAAFADLMRSWGVPVDGIFAWIAEAWDATTAWLSGPSDGESIIGWLWRPLGDVFGWLRDAWESIEDSLTGAFQSFLERLGLTRGAETVASHLAKITTALAFTGAALTATGVVAAGFSATLGVVAGALRVLVVGLRSVMASLGPVGWAFLAVSLAIVYWDELVALVQAAGRAISAAWQATTEYLSSMGRAFLDLLRSWGVPIDGIFSWIGGAWDAVVEYVVSRAQAIWSWMQGPDDGQSVFAWVMEAFVAVLGELGAAFANFVILLSEPIVGIFDWVGDQLAAALLAAWEKVPAPIRAFLGRGVQVAGEVVADLSGVASSVGSTVAEGVEHGVGMARSAAESLAGAIDEYLPHSDAERGPLSDLTASGSAIAQTLADGIRIRSDDVRMAMGEMFAMPEISLPELGGFPERIGLPELGGFPERIGLPELGGFPERIGLPELGGFPERIGLPELGGFPERIGLPELGGFPERIGLPELDLPLPSLDAPPPVGPPITAINDVAAQREQLAAPQNRSVTIEVGRIEVDAQGGDADEIARNLTVAIEEQMRRAAEQADSMEVA